MKEYYFCMKNFSNEDCSCMSLLLTDLYLPDFPTFVVIFPFPQRCKFQFGRYGVGIYFHVLYPICVVIISVILGNCYT